jgi:hypothetical protein
LPLPSDKQHGTKSELDTSSFTTGRRLKLATVYCFCLHLFGAILNQIISAERNYLFSLGIDFNFEYQNLETLQDLQSKRNKDD